MRHRDSSPAAESLVRSTYAVPTRCAAPKKIQEDPRTRGGYGAGGLYRPDIRDSAPTQSIDLACIPEPRVTDETPSAYGNQSPYTVLGKKYYVLRSVDGYVERGLASYYGTKFHGRLTSNHEVYDMNALTAAHRTLPLPSFALVTNLQTGASVVVRVNDRGPFHKGRLVDLSYAAAMKIGIVQKGTGEVEVRALTPENAPALLAQRRTLPFPTHVASTAGDDQSVAAQPEQSAARIKTTPAVTTPSPVATVVQPSARSIALQTDKSLTKDPVSLQIGSFANRANADRALAKIVSAGIPQAHMYDIKNQGKTFWRVYVSAPDTDTARVLAQHLTRLGFANAVF